MDDTADKYLRLQSDLESSRVLFESTWREVAERVRPNQNLFSTDVSPGERRDQLVWDDTAPLALSKFTAAVISMSFPATTQWHGLTTQDPRISEIPAVKRYFEELTRQLFKVRYAPRANFQSQLGEMVMDVGSFGTGCLFIDELPGIGIRYKSIPLSELYICEDGTGGIDTVHRKWRMSARQAMHWAEKMGFADRMPPAIRDAAEKQPMSQFWFLHAVGPNKNRQRGRADYHGMEFSSCYIACETRTTLSEGGYHSFPYAVGRFETAPRETYGRGPGVKVLRTIKALNEMKKTVIRAGQLVVAPPIMLSDDASLTGFDLRSNALNFGYMAPDGKPLAAPFQSGGRVDIGLDMMDKEREVINDAFFVTLFRILVEQPQITATEAMLRAQEKGQLLAPTMGRMQSDVGGPMIARELDLMMRADMDSKRLGGPGFLPEMPQELIDAGGEYHTEYKAPLNEAQRAGAGVAILNTIQALAPIAASLGEDAGRAMARMFEPQRTMRELAEANGMPERVLRTPEEIEALEQQDAQAAQVQSILQAAPVAASAAKDLAQANALSASSPSGAAPQIIPA